MYKKLFLLCFFFLAPVGIIEQHKNDRTTLIINYVYDMIWKKNLHLVDNLFEANEENSIEKKNYWGKGDLVSQQRCCSYSEKTFQNF